MKRNTFLLLLSLWLGSLPAVFSQNLDTSGDNSPAVIAKNFSAQYDVRPDAILALLWVYEQEKYSPQECKRRTEAVIKMYKETPEKKQGAALLSDNTKNQLGLAPAVADALDWDLFARKNYLSLSTTGANSPAVVAGGDVNIWYGVPPKVVRALTDYLEKNKVDLADLGKRLEEQVKKYEELRTELASRADNDAVAKRAKQLLEEGNIAEAERILEEDFDRDAKKLAYKAFELAQVKVLALKYNEATPYYQKAALLDENNSRYPLAYGFHLYNIARYDEAIIFYQKALAIDTVAFKYQPEKAAKLYNNLGSAWMAKGEYDRAISYFEKAFAIDSLAFGNKRPVVAIDFNNLGSAWLGKGEYDRAIAYFEKALPISIQSFGEKHSNVAAHYSNLGTAYREKGEYDRAITYYEKALPIFIQSFGKKHPDVAALCSSIGEAYRQKGEYDRAIAYQEIALAIDSIAFGSKHPNVAIAYNNLGLAWQDKGKYDRAIAYFEKALTIDSITFGNMHPKMATQYNNLGSAWQNKGEYDRAIAYFEKALPIFIQSFGEKHPNSAFQYNNLGTAYLDKGEYDRAIAYFEKCEVILVKFFEPNHPYCKSTNLFFSRAANDRGIELAHEEKYAEALPYFQKALENAEQAEDWSFLLICFSNVGCMQKLLEHYGEGLAILEKGLVLAEGINVVIDEELKKYPAEQLRQPAVQTEIAELRNLSIIREMRYHKAGCLAGLGRKKEADELYQQLLKEAREANDTRLLEDLKNDGVKD